MFRKSRISTVKKQKDVIHKTQNFQEAQKTNTYCKIQIRIETQGEFQEILKFI